MRITNAVALLAVGCGSGTGPGEVPVIETGRYVLTEFDGKAPPAVSEDITYPEIRHLWAIDYDTVVIESQSTFRRALRSVYVEVRPGQPPDTLSTDGVSYPGMILERDGAVLLVIDPLYLPFFNVDPVEFRPGEGLLRRRMRVRVTTCPTGEVLSCQVTRQSLLDAVYARR